MPCDSGPMSYDLDRTQEKLDRVTRVACEMEKLLTPAQQKKLSVRTLAWIEKHRLIDARRKDEEKERVQQKKERKKALAKLSLRERALLNVRS